MKIRTGLEHIFKSLTYKIIFICNPYEGFWNVEIFGNSYEECISEWNNSNYGGRIALLKCKQCLK